MILYIKNMTTVAAKILVEREMQALDIPYLKLGLGTIEMTNPPTMEQMEAFREKLLQLDLELLEDTRSILTEKVKNAVHEMINLANELPKINYSDYLSEKIGNDYTYMANVFIEMTGITIRQFIISQRIEKVKELLLRDELNLTEISNQLNYSSVGHLSNQFKKFTGLSPSRYKKLKAGNWNLVLIK